LESPRISLLSLNTLKKILRDLLKYVMLKWIYCIMCSSEYIYFLFKFWFKIQTYSKAQVIVFLKIYEGFIFIYMYMYMHMYALRLLEILN
jgi:hypothetical protein